MRYAWHLSTYKEVLRYYFIGQFQVTNQISYFEGLDLYAVDWTLHVLNNWHQKTSWIRLKIKNLFITFCYNYSIGQTLFDYIWSNTLEFYQGSLLDCVPPRRKKIAENWDGRNSRWNKHHRKERSPKGISPK